MSRWDWDFQPSRPIRVTGGIQAQTQRGAFGKTWWAGRWIAALERLGDSGRLRRGRSYARNGQVLTLGVGPEGVTATVQGSRPRPYDVSIRFRRLADSKWERVIAALAAEALYAAKLLNGEMPEHIEEAFAAAGTSLFPATGRDLVTHCSCPDWSNPCKHIAAVHYLLGERFDADPFLILLLRGRSQEDISAALRLRRASATSASLGDAPRGEEDADEAEPSGLPGSMTAYEFWALSAEVEALAVSFAVPPVDALAVKRLGPPPFIRDPEDFTRRMEETYRVIAARARQLVDGE